MIPAWSVVVAVALCVLSAVAYACGALLQQQVAQAPMRALLRTPRWWLGMSANGVGAVLHVVALRYGSLTLVQALGALTLVAAVPLAAAAARRRITRAELTGTALTTGALVALLAVTGSSSQALTLRAGVGVLLAAGVIMAWAALQPRLPGLAAAAVGGMAFGVASALTQAITLRLDAGVPTLAAGVAAVVGLNVAAVWFTQRSYRSGLAAPLAVGTVANPVTAAVIGVALLGQTFQGGALGVVVLLASAAALATGVCLLAQAQSMPAQPTPQPRSAAPVGQHRTAAIVPLRPSLLLPPSVRLRDRAFRPEPAAPGPLISVAARAA
ncbi:DMT family transporter [Paractinoplanes lichenicola]|uniref:DMT family transporter n=1 Tax=Paractinoplanes lichenicola TaxID=2802976 RepID=A0ABS1VHV6_9ACTN|nr:DMT family transporter [Actinoplanes lichenicola]MBL7254287.1 DMT family transporter [Actinoplanes lichenicola]